MRRVSKREIEIGMRVQPGTQQKRPSRKQKLEMEQTALSHQFVPTLAIGQIVRARVIWRNRSRTFVQLECGLHVSLDDCLDHDEGQKVEWLTVPAVGQWMDVYIRSLRDVGTQQAQVRVSAHTYSRDVSYAFFDSGYRSSYDGIDAPFAKLPWETPWFDRKKRSVWH